MTNPDPDPAPGDPIDRLNAEATRLYHPGTPPTTTPSPSPSRPAAPPWPMGSQPARAGRRWESLAGPGLALGALALYTQTVAPSLGGTMDSAEFQEASYALALAHATGYPLYLLLGRLWITLVPLGDPAFRMNCLSAVFAALAVWVLYALARQVGGSARAAAGAAALFAVTAIPWAEAGVAEINSLNTLLTGLAFLAVIRWAGGQLPLYAATLAIGVALSHHRTALLYLPLLLLYGLVAWRRGRPRHLGRRDLMAAGALLLVPFLAYLYLPLRAATTPWYQNDWDGFSREVLGTTALPVILATLGRPLGPRFQLVLFDLAFHGPTGWALLGLGLLGLGGLAYAGARARRSRAPAPDPGPPAPAGALNRPALLLCAAAFGLGIGFAALYDIIDIGDYLAVPLFFWSVLVAAGLAGLLRGVDGALRRRPIVARWASGVLVLGLAGLVGLTAAGSLARQDIRVDFSHLDRRSAWAAIEAESPQIPAGAVLIADAAGSNEALYLQRVDGWRPDLSVVRVEDVRDADFTPIARWLQQQRPVYLLAPYAEILTRYRVRPAGPLAEVRGRQRADAPPAMVQRLDRRFGDHMLLLGYTLAPDPPVLPAGGTLKVTLFWTETARVYERYTIFNHVVDAQGTLVGQQDDEPNHGFKPTAVWQPGEVVTDTFAIPIRPSAPPGPYWLITGLYTSVTIQRLPAFSADGRPLGDYPTLAPLTVK